MGKQTKKFNIDYHIEISGKGKNDFMSNFIKSVLDGTVLALKMQHTNLKVFLNGKEL